MTTDTRNTRLGLVLALALMALTGCSCSAAINLFFHWLGGLS